MSSFVNEGKNWCAKNSLRFVRDFVSRHNHINFDPNSHAYSWDIQHIHFVQLHNYPNYEEKSIGIRSAIPWLKKDLAKARENNKVIILNMHQPGMDLQEELEEFQISANFIGHIHSRIGFSRVLKFDNNKKKNPDFMKEINSDSERDLNQGAQPISLTPTIFSGSPGYNRMLAVVFKRKYMQICQIATEKGIPRIVKVRSVAYRSN